MQIFVAWPWYITLITVIIHVEVPLLKKICLFGGYVGKNAKDVFRRVREKIITLLILKVSK